MASTNIEWTERVWNPFAGCSVLSPGCTNCYAMKMARRIEACNAGLRQGHGGSPHYAGTTKVVNGNAVWTGKIGIASDEVLTAPLRRKKPTTYFVNSMSDLFHEGAPDEAIDKVFAVMALTPQHTYQVLTKRSARMRAYCTNLMTPTRLVAAALKLLRGEVFNATWPLPNVWLGVSTERQKEADERVPDLLATPAAVRFISAEPLLGPIDLTLDGLACWDCPHCADSSQIEWDTGANACRRCEGSGKGDEVALDWVIVGGESGPGARPMHPDWARSIRDQCTAAGVPFFFKQWGGWRPLTEAERVTACGATAVYPTSGRAPSAHDAAYMLRSSKASAGRLLDGVEHNAMPEATPL